MTEKFEPENTVNDPELKELLARGEAEGLADIVEIMGGGITSAEAEEVVRKIDAATMDDARTYELNQMLIERDRAGKDTEAGREISARIKSRIEEILK